MTIWRNVSGNIIVDGSGIPIDCAVCPCDSASTPCNPTPVPRTLTLVVTYKCVQFSVTLHYDPTVIAGQPGWTYIGPGGPNDIAICGVIKFRDFSLACAGGTWTVEFAYLDDSGIQQVAATGGAGLTSVVVVSTSPLCVTTTGPGFAFSSCGGVAGTFYFAAGAGCVVVPTCCNWGSLSSTATATYTLGALSPATRNLSSNGIGYGDSGFSCTVGDGTVITLSFDVACDGSSDCTWAIAMTMQHIQLSPFTILKTISWDLSNIIPGTVRSDGTAFNCSPFHAHMSILNTSGPGSSSTVTCGGKAYPFGPAGTITGTLDIVTP